MAPTPGECGNPLSYAAPRTWTGAIQTEQKASQIRFRCSYRSNQLATVAMTHRVPNSGHSCTIQRRLGWGPILSGSIVDQDASSFEFACAPVQSRKGPRLHARLRSRGGHTGYAAYCPACKIATPSNSLDSTLRRRVGFSTPVPPTNLPSPSFPSPDARSPQPASLPLAPPSASPSNTQRPRIGIPLHGVPPAPPGPSP